MYIISSIGDGLATLSVTTSRIVDALRKKNLDVLTHMASLSPLALRFRQFANFVTDLGYRAEMAHPPEERDAKELYVARLYNHLIGKGIVIRHNLIGRDAFIFCGVPQEYENFRAYPV